MRKYTLMLLVVSMVLALCLGAAACGSGGSATNNLTPQELLTTSVDAAKDANLQSGTYEIILTVDQGSTTATAGDQAAAQALLAQPIKISGTFATQTDAALADLTLGVDLMGTNMGVGIRTVATSAWVNVLGQWYEVPADALQQSSTTGDADIAATLKQAVDDQAIDINTWLKDLKVAGEETLVDTEVTHLTGTLDVQKMVTDILALLQNPKVAALMATAGSEASSETGVTVPDAAALQEAQATVQQMIKGATLDLWMAKSDASMRKAVLATDITIPAEMGTSGIAGANIVATFNFNAPNTAVEVKAPTSAKPLTDLQTDLQSNPLLSGLLGGLSGGGSLLGQ